MKNPSFPITVFCGPFSNVKRRISVLFKKNSHSVRMIIVRMRKNTEFHRSQIDPQLRRVLGKTTGRTCIQKNLMFLIFDIHRKAPFRSQCAFCQIVDQYYRFHSSPPRTFTAQRILAERARLFFAHSPADGRTASGAISQYCPFLRKYLKDFFTSRSSPE